MSPPRQARVVAERHVSGPRRAGDVAAAQIERHVLAPAREHAPGIAAAVQRCGGCTQAKHALGSTEPHPDPGTVV